jgi:SSS family solute:Na+ symporter
MPFYASTILKGIVDYISKYTGASFELILLIVGVLAAIFVATGGLKGIMYSDAFQGAIMFAGMLFLIIYTYSMLGGITKAHEALGALPQAPGVAEQTENLLKAALPGGPPCRRQALRSGGIL